MNDILFIIIIMWWPLIIINLLIKKYIINYLNENKKEKIKKKRNLNKCECCKKSLINDKGNLNNNICVDCEKYINIIKSKFHENYNYKYNYNNDKNYKNLFKINLNFLNNKNKYLLLKINYKNYNFYDINNKKLEINTANDFLKYRKQYILNLKEKIKINKIKKDKLKKIKQDKRYNYPVCKYCNQELPLKNYYKIDTINNKNWYNDYVILNQENAKPPCKKCKRKYR